MLRRLLYYLKDSAGSPGKNHQHPAFRRRIRGNFGNEGRQNPAELSVGLDPEKRSEIVEELDYDDASDLISQLDEDEQQEILEDIDQEDATNIRALMSYAEDTAGGLRQRDNAALLKIATDVCAQSLVWSRELYRIRP